MTGTIYFIAYFVVGYLLMRRYFFRWCCEEFGKVRGGDYVLGTMFLPVWPVVLGMWWASLDRNAHIARSLQAPFRWLWGTKKCNKK